MLQHNQNVLNTFYVFQNLLGKEIWIWLQGVQIFYVNAISEVRAFQCHHVEMLHGTLLFFFPKCKKLTFLAFFKISNVKILKIVTNQINSETNLNLWRAYWIVTDVNDKLF